MTLFAAAAAAHFLPRGAKAANEENLFFRFHFNLSFPFTPRACTEPRNNEPRDIHSIPRVASSIQSRGSWAQLHCSDYD